MSENKKKIVLINGSPKMSDSGVSRLFTTMQEKYFNKEGAEIFYLNVRDSLTKGTATTDFEILHHADAIVFNFPLYVFCLPGILMRFLQDYYQFNLEHKSSEKDVKIYTLINCGFPEAYINSEAARVIQSFSKQINASFRFAVLVGGGPMLIGTTDAPFMAKTLNKMNDAFALMAKDVGNQEKPIIDNIEITMNFPSRLYYFAGDRGWISSVRKNGLKKRDLYRRPYQI